MVLMELSQLNLVISKLWISCKQIFFIFITLLDLFAGFWKAILASPVQYHQSSARSLFSLNCMEAIILPQVSFCKGYQWQPCAGRQFSSRVGKLDSSCYYVFRKFSKVSTTCTSAFVIYSREYIFRAVRNDLMLEGTIPLEFGKLSSLTQLYVLFISTVLFLSPFLFFFITLSS